MSRIENLNIECKDRGCFRQTIGAFVVPTPLIKSDGHVFTCSIFGMPEELLLGNVNDLTIREILAAANNNRYVRMLADGSLPALMRNMPSKMLQDIVVDNFHEACWKLVRMHQENAVCSRLEN